MPNVFLTPFEIRESVQQVFPQARFDGTVRENVFTLKCVLSDKTSPIHIEKAINALKFVPALELLFSKTVVQNYRPKEDFKLDIENFSLVPPLSNWKLFQRSVFKEKGKRIEDLLIKYLKNEDKQGSLYMLEQLGLAPNQVGNTLSKEDEEVFLALCESIEGISKAQPQTARVLIERFRTEYPAISEHVVALFIEQERARSRIETPTGIGAILHTLKQRVIGQDAASDIMGTALCADDKKNKNFLFVGPTGIGKTEMGKAVSAIKKNRFLMLAMNTYSESHSTTNLFGSPQGYVGSQDKPHLVKELEKFQPKVTGSDGANTIYEVENMVILFDELEKAHSEVKQSLLTLFDEGWVQVKYTQGSSNQSEKYIFKDAIFIATSNLYSEMIKKSFKERKNIKDTARSFVQQNAMRPSRTSFSPEFLGRFEIVPFGPIPRGKEYFQKIIKQKMDKSIAIIKTQLNLSGFQVEEEDKVLSILESRLYGEGINIRKLQRFFDQDLNTVIYTRIASEIGLVGKSLVLSPFKGRYKSHYEEKKEQEHVGLEDVSTIGVKAVDFVLGSRVDFSELFPVII